VPGPFTYPLPHPAGAGYGGVGWSPRAGDGTFDPQNVAYGYGEDSYGAIDFPAPPIAVDGGYGGDPYGTGPYGGIELVPPRLSSAVSLNGWEIEVFFSEEMDPNDLSLVDPLSYLLTPVDAAASEVLSVRIEKLGSISLHDHFQGVLSVIITHTGTTLGGTYEVWATGPTDVSGNPILDIPFELLTIGEAPVYTVSAASGNELLFQFSHAMLSAADEPAGSPGITNPASYQFTSDPDYPITLTPVIITHPYNGDASQVHQEVQGMTSVQYNCTISPATEIEYDGTILPSEATTFTGTEVFPGNGQSLITGGKLILNKAKVLSYGWDFLVLGGTIPADSTFRADVIVNAGAAIYAPPLAAFTTLNLGQAIFATGPVGMGTQATVTLQKVAGNQDRIHIQSGVWITTVMATWSSGDITLSMVRNRKAGFITFLLGGVPLVTVPTATISEPSTLAGAGVRWLLSPSLTNISGFQLLDVSFEQTETVWSAAWNFLHNMMGLFQGSAAHTRPWLLTQRGPLVKDWGDMTPATKQDVALWVNGGEVDVSDVNPYWGKVTPTIPIPLLPPGDPQADVKIDYHWMATPIMPLAGLNVEGAVLNKWDRATGHHDPAFHGEQIQDATHAKGAPDISRFPMGVVIGPPDYPEPLLVSHRYMGFEKDASALLNSPTTMILNQDPRVSQVPAFESPTEGTTRAFEGAQSPTLDDPPWTLEGQDTGSAVNGIYTVIDSQSGAFNPDDPKVAMYWGEIDLNFPSNLYLVGKFSVPKDPVTEVASVSPHGVFTGVGFGVHDNHHLYLAGAIQLGTTDIIRHVGILKDPTMMHLLDGWDLGPKATISIISSTVCTAASSSVPTGFTTGGRFNILSGSQAGVYTASSVIRHSTGTTEITVTPGFPANPKLYDNKYFDAIFEVDWVEDSSTYRMVVDPEQRTATLDISGRLSGRVATLDGTVAHMPQPAQTSLLLSTEYEGQVFWGSLDSFAVSHSSWSFLRYGIVPDQTSLRGYVQVVNTEMGDLPEEDPNEEWFLTEPFGTSEILMTGGMQLKSTAGSDAYNLVYGYSRIEPFLFPDANVDLRAFFGVDSAVLGAGDAEIVLQDGVRVIRLATLMYYEGDDPWRQLVEMPSVSCAGFMSPDQQGWDYSGDVGNDGLSEGPDFTLTVPAGETTRYRATADTTGLVCGDPGDRIGEVLVASDAAGYLFTLASPSGHSIQFWLREGATPGVELRTEAGVIVQAYDFDWTDDALHAYRLIASSGVASLLIDNTLQLPTVGMGPFASGGSSQFLFGSVAPTSDMTTRWRSVSYSVIPPATVKRTFGIWLGGNKDDIDQWQIPRTDSTTAKNSDEIGPVVEEMDWRTPMEVRLLRTPEWGVTMLRPDLPMPPYYVPETPGVPGSGYATQTAVPSAGWINVEDAEIPKLPAIFGSISFGALDQRSVTQQHWDWVRYKIFKTITEEHKSPDHMVLNQNNVLTSGDWLLDRTLETATLQVASINSLALAPLHMVAEGVYKVVDGSTVYARTDWTFDANQQTLVLDKGLNFSSATATVTVLFYPGKPITDTYLLGQPVQDGMTLLNEGTPPVPMSQGVGATHEEIHGSFLNDPAHILNENPGFTLNDPYNVLVFVDDAEALYENMKFMEVDNSGDTGLISTPCEGTLPQGFSGHSPDEGEEVYSKTGTGASLGGVGQSAGLKATGTKVGEAVGAHVLGFKGTKFWEKMTSPKPSPFEQGGGMPGKTLFASGGNYLGPVVDLGGQIIDMKPLGGTLGPGTAVLYPNFVEGAAKPGTGIKGIYRRTDWFLRLHAVIGQNQQEKQLIEIMSLDSADNTPPTTPYRWAVNPSGTPPVNGYGACLAEYTGAGEYSHTGPWGGLSALEAAQDFGILEFLGLTVPVGTTAEVRSDAGWSVVFTAVAVPVLPTEFAAAPTPHLSLADAINNHAVTRNWVEAVAGLTWWGSRAVTVESLSPVVVGNLVSIWGTPPQIVVQDVLGTEAGGILTGGAKINQSSVLAGGWQTVNPVGPGEHDPLLGFVCQGGALLPVGGTVIEVLSSPAV